MCGFEELISTYRNCRLPQYSSIGRTVTPHEIVSRYIHQCADPRPANGSNDKVCEKRFQQNLKPVRDPDDRGHTKVAGECPACKAAEDRCLEVTIVPHINLTARNSVITEPNATPPVVEQSPVQNQETEKIRRPPAGGSRPQRPYRK